MRTRALLLSVLSILALSGTTAAAAAPVTCGPFPPRRAWALSIGPGGETRWTTPLPVGDAATEDNVAPVTTSTTGVFAAAGAVYGLRLSDGHELWHADVGQALYGQWLVHGVVSVLADQVGKRATLSGYDVSTGERLWRRNVGGDGLYADQFLTRDGGLVWTTEDGRLQVVDLTTGKLRWSHRETTSQGVQYESPRTGSYAGLALYAAKGALAAYDDRTGRLAWRVTGLAPSPSLQVVGSLALTQSNFQGGNSPTAVVAVDLTTGKRLWTYDPHGSITGIAGGHDGVAVAAYFTDRPGHKPILAMLNPRTGKAMWSVTTNVAYASQYGTPLVNGSDLVSVESGEQPYPAVGLVDRNVASGHVRWRAPLHAAASRPEAVLVFGAVVVTEVLPSGVGKAGSLHAYRAADGHALWTVDAPTLINQGIAGSPDGYLAIAEDPVQGCAD